jgi:hypothetical protein
MSAEAAYVKNPRTNRWVLRRTTLGRRIIRTGGDGLPPRAPRAPRAAAAAE